MIIAPVLFSVLLVLFLIDLRRDQTGLLSSICIFGVVILLFLALSLIIVSTLAQSDKFYRSMAQAQAKLVKREIRVVRGGSNEAEVYKQFVVTIEFLAAQKDGGSQQHIYEALVGRKLYTELGSTVMVRYAQADPKILLLEGE